MAFPQKRGFNKNVNIYMYQQDYDAISQIARKFNIFRGDCVRRLLRNYLDGNVRIEDLFDTSELIVKTTK